jgi:putative DNA primase/helicase
MTDAELDQCRQDGAFLHSIVSRQVELKPEGNRWKGRCPFHDDSTPSFTLFDGGRFKCFGCGASGTVFDYVMLRDRVDFRRAAEIIAAERGLSSSKPKPANGNGGDHGEVWFPGKPPPGDKPGQRKLTCDMLHEYRDADDQLTFYVRRTEGTKGQRKQFVPLTYGTLIKNGHAVTGWHNKAPDVPRPLYRLNALSRASADAVVLLVEGEKAADAAQRILPDYVAMTWMGGANADSNADLSPLKDRKVIIWPDADVPGRNAAARLAKRLSGARIVDTTGLPDGFDAADLELSGELDPVSWLQARLREPEQQQKPEKEQDGPEPPSEADPAKIPVIIVRGGERHLAADAAIAAMAQARVPFYRRDRDLVRILRIKVKQSNGNVVLMPAVVPVTLPFLLRTLGRTAHWRKLDRQHQQVSIDPPKPVAEQILGMIDEWPFPPLRGVIATQTMRHDGTLLIEPGYDPATGLVLFDPPPMPDVPDRPSRRDAEEALKLLGGLLDEFSFTDDDGVSRSAAMSMLMTATLRGAMPVAPMHVITKPEAGTGGSYLQDVMAAIAIGERCPVLSLVPDDDRENEKRLHAAALGQQPIIALDNLSSVLMGDFLCQLIERPMFKVRILGHSELVNITNSAFVVANGNNLVIGADTVRRAVEVALDANMENPETRRFTRDPVAEVLADRGRYVAAILTIARAYVVAGWPDKQDPLASFEAWSDLVRSALVWLGWPDPLLSAAKVRAEDPLRSTLRAVVDAWSGDLQLNVGYTTSELVRIAAEYMSDGRRALWEALSAAAPPKNGQIDPVKLGLWLRGNVNRVTDGNKLTVDRETNKAKPRWLLVSR